VPQTKLLAGLLLAALAVVIAYAAATAYAASYRVAVNKTAHKALPIAANKTVPKPHPLYVTARHLVINGNKIYADLTVDVVNADASRIAGRVVYGTGTLTLGNATYAVKTAYGTVTKGSVKLTLYTGNSIVLLQYKHSYYFAIVKPLGRPGVERFGGRVTLKIQ